MNIEDHVTNLELSKKLKELGVKQESLFAWISENEVEFLPFDIRNINVCISAFFASELLEFLPDLENGRSLRYGAEYPSAREECGGKYYSVCDAVDYPHDKYFYSNNFADCLAMMLIHLIENKIIEIPAEENQ